MSQIIRKEAREAKQRASFKVACALQPYTVEEMGSRPTPTARLRLGPGGCAALLQCSVGKREPHLEI